MIYLVFVQNLQKSFKRIKKIKCVQHFGYITYILNRRDHAFKYGKELVTMVTKLKQISEAIAETDICPKIFKSGAHYEGHI